jgi:hypothetical protein
MFQPLAACQCRALQVLATGQDEAWKLSDCFRCQSLAGSHPHPQQNTRQRVHNAVCQYNQLYTESSKRLLKMHTADCRIGSNPTASQQQPQPQSQQNHMRSKHSLQASSRRQQKAANETICNSHMQMDSLCIFGRAQSWSTGSICGACWPGVLRYHATLHTHTQHLTAASVYPAGS